MVNPKKSNEQYNNELFEKEIDIWPIEEYDGTHVPILHECLKGHRWKIRPSHVLAGHNCPSCAKWGFKLNEPAILYYVKISKDNETYYKIGVTGRDIKRRFRDERDKEIVVLQETLFNTGTEALKIEQEILQKFPRINMKGFLKTGYSELFEYDVLELDN